ncbi:hypothetical protein GLOTRDRAFT_127864 [Gloeophyllum trabeum ATCC 11539]|uniref:Uncharacterized protein n=1 Tax=Gloeophyllum trabeum (strain ATCC 11539 / FP-39264 / Madison 617) TaxID=670483 RepID=S7QC94_GLOTA|nr:uncharacterized protein GLOTRDRAFT_127864 [Gloeophyllum trabeum ATCC 11539]EPQ57511.1 hypothetical protein GLOTRDRAFT_127864 [Gloeophyllum trabeum ATCC 11539]
MSDNRTTTVAFGISDAWVCITDEPGHRRIRQKIKWSPPELPLALHQQLAQDRASGRPIQQVVMGQDYWVILYRDGNVATPKESALSDLLERARSRGLTIAV